MLPLMPWGVPEVLATFYLGQDNSTGQGFTEAQVLAYLKTNVVGATLTPAVGLWQGATEASWRIEVGFMHPPGAWALAQDMARHFNQESVGLILGPDLQEVKA